MKHKATVILSVIVIVLVGIISVQAYNHHRVSQKAHDAQIAAQAAAATRLKDAEQESYDIEVNNLLAICHKNLTAWQSLSAVQQARQPEPNCNLQSVQ